MKMSVIMKGLMENSESHYEQSLHLEYDRQHLRRKPEEKSRLLREAVTALF